MEIRSAKYLTSVTKRENILQDGKSEFAFVGRSNVGKSSMINSLVGQKSLARSSAKPGLTRMINYFDINDGAFRFVDLPGYGYHKAGKVSEQMWASLMEDYLASSQCLRTVFLLVDCRIEPTELDKMMLHYLLQTGRNFMIIATKCDKLSKPKQNLVKGQISKVLKIRPEAIILHSSQTNQGREQILTYIENMI